MPTHQIIPDHEYRRVGDLESLSLSGQAHNIDLVERVDDPGKIYVRKTYRFAGTNSHSSTVSKDQEYLLSECKIQSSLSHPNIVRLLDYEYRPQISRWEAYLYMEYCPLGDLSQYIRSAPTSNIEGRQLTEKQWWSITYQISLALLYCHNGISIIGESMLADENWQTPIFHRDLKPQNILVSETNGENMTVKLCDFGFAKHQHSIHSTSYLGTHGYIPPEIAVTSSAWSAKADVFAMGRTMQIVAGDLEALASISVHLQLCVHRDPEKRPLTPTLVDATSKVVYPNEHTRRIAWNVCHEKSLRALKRLDRKYLAQGDDVGITPMHLATSEGWMPGVLYLQQQNQDIGIKNNIDGSTPMHYAARYGHIQMVNHLQQLGQDIGIKDNDGETPMHYAAQGGQIQMVNHLQQLGQYIGIKDKYGRILMHVAAQNGQIQMVNHLQQLGQDVGIEDENGRTPMHYAAHGGQIQMVNHMQQLGQDIGVKDDDGAKPMHFAAQNGQIQMVNHMQQLGQDIGIKDDDGETPMHHAARTGQIEMINHLQKLGQDVEVVDKYGGTPMDLAARYGRTELVDHLRKLGCRLRSER